MKYRLFHMDPYFMVYDLIPTSLGSISSPIHQKQPGAQTFHCSFLRQKKFAKTRNQWTATGTTEGHLSKGLDDAWKAIPVTLCQTNIFENKPSWEKKFIFQSNQKKNVPKFSWNKKKSATDFGHKKYRMFHISFEEKCRSFKKTPFKRKLKKNRFGNIHQFFTNPGFPRWQTSGNYKGTHTDTVTWMLSWSIPLEGFSQAVSI